MHFEATITFADDSKQKLIINLYYIVCVCMWTGGVGVGIQQVMKQTKR